MCALARLKANHRTRDRTLERTSTTELVTRTRLAVLRLARRLRQQAHAASRRRSSRPWPPSSTTAPSPSAPWPPSRTCSPPSITRIVAALEDQGYVERTAAPDDRRVSTVDIAPQRTPRAARHPQRAQRLAGQPAGRARPRPSSAASTRPCPSWSASSAATHDPGQRRRPHHLPVAAVAQLPPLLLRPDRLGQRHLDAERRPGLARAAAHRQRHLARPGHRLPVPADAPARSPSAASWPTASTSGAS